MTKIKICGLTRIVDIEAVNEAKPDYIGFVFAKSKRQVNKQQASLLKGLLSPDIKAVGVFVNSPIEFVEELLKENIIDIAQLHGNEDDNYIDDLRRRTDKEIIKAVRINSKNDLLHGNTLKANYLLLDNGGGTGQSFDWMLIDQPIKMPFFLAGGIDIDNIAKAIKDINPYAIDLSSGVETDGMKDKQKIMEIVRRIRNV